MKLLYSGGTGEVSYECLVHAVETGQHCTVFIRGRDSESLPKGVRLICGTEIKSCHTNRKQRCENYSPVLGEFLSKRLENPTYLDASSNPIAA